MERSKDIASIFREMQKLITRHGVDKFLDFLRSMQDSRLGSEGIEIEDTIDYIIVITSNFYNLNKNDVMYSSDKRIYSLARRMCFGLIKHHLNVSDEGIGKCFGGKSRQYINKEIKSLPMNLKYYTNNKEREFVADFMSISEDVIRYRNEYSLNN